MKSVKRINNNNPRVRIGDLIACAEKINMFMEPQEYLGMVLEKCPITRFTKNQQWYRIQWFCYNHLPAPESESMLDEQTIIEFRQNYLKFKRKYG